MSAPPPIPEQTAPADQARWFATEVQPHEGELRAYLRRRFPGAEVDDLVQESFLRLLKARAAGHIACARAYLFTTARNAAFAVFRRPRIFAGNRVTDPGSLDIVEDRPGIAEQVSARQEIALLLEAIDGLPPRCREIFILRKLKNVPAADIARQLGLSSETVQVQLGRGAKKCVQYLRARGVDRLP